MQFSTLSAVLLMPLLAVAQYPTGSSSSTTSLTTTITSTQTMTKTITVSKVVASVYSTYGASNSTGAASPTIGSVKVTPTAYTTAASTTLPSNYMGAASSLNGMYAGGAGLVVMVAAALL